MRGICLLNPINSRQAFALCRYELCDQDARVVNASDVDHVSKVFSYAFLTCHCSPTWEISIAPPYILHTGNLTETSFACSQSKQWQMGSREILRLFVIKLAQCKYVSSMFLRGIGEGLFGVWIKKYLGLQRAGRCPHVDVCCPFSSGFELLWVSPSYKVFFFFLLFSAIESNLKTEGFKEKSGIKQCIPPPRGNLGAEGLGWLLSRG